MDIESLDKWNDYTEAKEAMFFYTDTADAPWTMIKSNDKKRARLEAMRHVLHRFDYHNKDLELVGRPDPLLVGRASQLFEDDEAPIRQFPQLWEQIQICCVTRSAARRAGSFVGSRLAHSTTDAPAARGASSHSTGCSCSAALTRTRSPGRSPQRAAIAPANRA